MCGYDNNQIHQLDLTLRRKTEYKERKKNIHINDGSRQYLQQQQQKGNKSVITKKKYIKKQTHQCPNKIKQNEKSHRKTTKSKQLRKERQFTKVVNRRINPSSTLRKQNTPRFRSHRMSNSIRTKLGLQRREMFHQKRRQKPIFTQREQILLM